jgi:hypothetical protein
MATRYQKDNHKSQIEEGQTTQVAIVLSVLPRFTISDYPFGILWPLYCLSFLDFVLSVIPRFTTSDYPFGILWPLYFLPKG